MSSTSPVLVTAANGNVGRAVVERLLALDTPVRAGIPAAGMPADDGRDIEHVRLDFTDPATFAPSLAGIRRLFLLRPPPIARVGPTINRFLDVAVASGVEHVVFSSVAGAERNRIVPHHRIEQHLLATGLDWTILRPGFFAQNLADAYRTDVRDHDRLYVPAGDGLVAFIDVRDLGDVAAMVLHDPIGHAGRAYTLTGPEAVTFHDLARVLTTELGRPIRYEPSSVGGYLRHLGTQGLPLAQRLVQTVLHTGLRRGQAAVVDPTLSRLLGHRARSVGDFVRDHRDLWASVSGPTGHAQFGP